MNHHAMSPLSAPLCAPDHLVMSFGGTDDIINLQEARPPPCQGDEYKRPAIDPALQSGLAARSADAFFQAHFGLTPDVQSDACLTQVSVAAESTSRCSSSRARCARCCSVAVRPNVSTRLARISREMSRGAPYRTRACARTFGSERRPSPYARAVSDSTPERPGGKTASVRRLIQPVAMILAIAGLVLW
jgi:hypothetical protein